MEKSTMNVERITQDMIMSKIGEMVAAGEKLSIRNIMAKTGGSPAKATEAKNAYFDLQQKQIDPASDELLAAITNDKIVAVAKARTEDVARIKSQEETIAELKEIITQSEVKNEKTQQEKAEMAAKLAATTTKIKLLEEELKTANDQKDTVLSEVATLKQQLQTASDKIAQLEKDTQEKAKLEQDCTAWKAKAEQAQEQLTALYNKFNIKS